MASVYILYSLQIDHYYVGSCDVLSTRLDDHISKKYKNSYTSKADDWKLFFEISELTLTQARNIEKHIKKMKSRKYIEDLKKYPGISQRLIKKYE